MDKRRAAAHILALAERCEAAAKRFDVTSDAYAVAEFASPHNQAEEDEALRRQGIALNEFRDVALPLIWARATTAAGLLAKATALKIAFPVDDDEELVLKIEKALEVEGVWDPDATLYSLIRDLVALRDAA